jgi:hypothetical protein
MLSRDEDRAVKDMNSGLISLYMYKGNYISNFACFQNKPLQNVS